jgi:hypothetical protein
MVGSRHSPVKGQSGGNLGERDLREKAAAMRSRDAANTNQGPANRELARPAHVHDFHGLALADLREGRVTEFGWPVQRIRPNPVGHLAKSPSGWQRRNREKMRKNEQFTRRVCHFATRRGAVRFGRPASRKRERRGAAVGKSLRTGSRPFLPEPGGRTSRFSLAWTTQSQWFTTQVAVRAWAVGRSGLGRLP